MPKIHPTAIVGPECSLGDDVEIGPYCVLDGKVSLGAGVRLLAHVNIAGPAAIGAGTTVYPGAALGFVAQDYKFKPGMPTAGIVIGRDCLIREGATVHAASKLDHATTVGDRVFMMCNSHVGHDTVVGNDVILVNGALLAGHVTVGDKAILSGGATVHQFVRVGRMSMASGLVVLTRDMLPFCLSGVRNYASGLNAVGLRRNGVSRDDIQMLRTAFRRAFRVALPRKEMVAILTELGRECPLVAEWAQFVATSKRGIVTGVSPRASRMAAVDSEE